MTILFEDLLTGDRLRESTEDIPGLGKVKIHEISAADQRLCIEGHDEKEGEELERHICFWACRFLKGAEPTKLQVDKFFRCTGTDVIAKIFGAGLSFNASAEDSKEQIEKK